MAPIIAAWGATGALGNLFGLGWRVLFPYLP